jgi:hypothetical protein
MERREARLAQAEATRPATRRPALAPRIASARPPQRALARLLSSREGLRMAIVAREILGPPKALQRPEGDGLL